ncbi:uncharacterized protein LTR77_009997 [Saxophila tyrrhenica]|uniref:Histone-lysine N-methyltransferase n=1 Tax=Saxophila tyrrhenica TaxID=1690608 RepID=A0AAV9P016_9PEZI|nr:hypothetical protein LTR77_009997 [Saxophila tyrrhenica]
MATPTNEMTRSNSTDSSALSNIMVNNAAADEGSSDDLPNSTPATSLPDGGSVGSAKSRVHAIDPLPEESSRRPKRARTGPSTYNVKSLLDAQEGAGSSSSRNVSGLTGRTLVDDKDDGALLGKKDDDGTIPMDWVPTELPPRKSGKLQRRPSVRDKVKKAANKVGQVLGKRGRDAMEAGKRKLGMNEVEESPKQSKIMRELDMGPKGVLDEMDLSDDEFVAPPPRPAKRAKIEAATAKELSKPTAPPLKISSGKQEKTWQVQGLYVGQDVGMDPAKKGGQKKLQKKRPGSAGSDGSTKPAADETKAEEAEPAGQKASYITLPMFEYLDKTRDFKIPFDIYAPSLKKGDEKPKDWKQVNKNRLVGEARELWEMEKLPSSMPPSNSDEQGCGDDCLNRVMQYECNDDNCSLNAELCSNRAFSELAARTQKGGRFDVGVEVLQTGNRGFGVRSCRTFKAGQIIMEYTGEIISEGECQRRMRDEYKDKQCYYLMELERGLVIDGTKGSMARFINHSCSPNCEVRMVKVNNTPRMAVFAAEQGIMTGQELTYDYNFDNFGATKQVCHCGAENCRGFLSKRLNATERKKLEREENDRKRKAAEEAQKNAESEARKKKINTDRGSGWRGWLAVDDPETKERLRAEKREREEAEKNSSRAQRLAARRQSLPAAAPAEKPARVLKKKNSARRKTTHLEEKAATAEPEEEARETSVTESTSLTTTHTRTVSRGSKFHEELDRPTTAQTQTSTITKRTEVSVSTTELLDDEGTLGDSEPSSKEAGEEVREQAEPSKKGLSRTASKGKDVMKSVGEAVRKGLKGIERAPSGSKMRQSTLSFAKIE